MLLLLYVLALLACFVFLARIVDLFFIPSLDQISKDLKLSSDAAGATLMAAGSSAPELFVALFAVLKPGEHQVIGIGSIVGSALFNILVIVGAASIIRKAKLTWQPIIRDLLFYIFAVGLLIWSISDGNFSFPEAIGFLVIYIVYIVAVVYWKKILPYKDNEYNHVHEEEDCNKSSGIIGMFDKLLCLIFPRRQYYYLNFLVSIIIIAGLSWLLVELAVSISSTLHVPEAIIALTVIAIGTSVPDLFSSLIVAKQGRSDMAVSNAVGSNIFDILIGLGFPFLIFMLVNESSIDAGGGDLLSASVILFASVILLVVLLLIGKWRMGKISGFTLVVLYVFYILREIVLIYL